ncbi:hypothetical protein J6590_027021 [Homalodisca vitripennis]|nr:hypothetical protein J6590_027021 [Homalodisca vitripennis]
MVAARRVDRWMDGWWRLMEKSHYSTASKLSSRADSGKVSGDLSAYGTVRHTTVGKPPA